MWRGIPKKPCYIIQNQKSGVSTGLALIWGIIDFSMFIVAIVGIFISKSNPLLLLPVAGFFALHLTPFWKWIGAIFKARYEVYNIEYVITNKRIFELNGRLKYMASSIPFEKIEGINYKQSSLDRFFRVADIYISGKTNKFVLFDIPNGLFIHDKLQEIISEDKNEDIKEKLFYDDNFECQHCGSYFEKKLTRCPSCGAPKEKI